MGNFTFTWDHPANEVYVTGTFDHWAKSVKLERKGDIFEKTVEIPSTNEKILYKFVVDGNWTTDHTAPSERDDSGITNNVLLPSQIKPSSVGANIISSAAHMLSSAAPKSTTAQLAGEQPKEPYYENPSTGGQPDEDTSGQYLPGAFPETPAQEPEQMFGVAPIPATAGSGNPVRLQPGEKVPHPSSLTGNTVESTVKTDRASYERSGAGAPQLGPVVTPEYERSASGGMFHLPPAIRNMIPESSLPMGGEKEMSEPDSGVTTQSAAPESTTAQLAGQVPKEPRGVPEVEEENEQDSGAKTESAAPEDITTQLPGDSPEEPRSAPEAEEDEDRDSGAKAQSAAPESTTAQLPGQYPEEPRDIPQAEEDEEPDSGATIQSAAPDSTTAQLAGDVPKEPRGVPEVVKESQQEADVEPEASESPEAVQKKSEVEQQLLEEVSEEPPIPEGGPVGGTRSLNPDIQRAIDNMNSRSGTTTVIPDVVAKSISKAHESPEAAANPEAVQEKAAVENELLKEVGRADGTGEPAPSANEPVYETAHEQPFNETSSALSPNSMADPEPLKSSTEPTSQYGGSQDEAAPFSLPIRSGLNAPADTPAQSAVTETATLEPEPAASRDVSPMSKPAVQQPVVTTGVASTTIDPPIDVPSAPSTPQKSTDFSTGSATGFGESAKGTPDSTRTSESGTTADKKNKRRSFFGRLKEKLK